MTTNYQKKWNEYQDETRREAEQIDYEAHLDEVARDEAAITRENRVNDIMNTVRDLISDLWPDEGADWYDDCGNLVDEMRWREADRRADEAARDAIDAMDDDVLYTREAAEIAYAAYADEINA